MINVKGLVISERDVGESGRAVTLLTADRGCLEVYVRGGRKSKKSLSTTQLFCYAEHSLDEKRDAHGDTHYYYNSSEPINLFYNIRLDAKKTALACYFAELLRFACESAEGAEEVMRLTLNTFYMLNKGEHSLELLKSIFELRLLCEAGFRPALIGCHVCYKTEDDAMHFNLRSGLLTCSEHAEESGDGLYDTILDKTQLYVVRYIALVEQERLFSFKLSDRYLEWLSDFTERFAEYHFGRSFNTLKFYKML